MLERFVHGARCFWRGLRLLNTPGLRGYAALPIAINMAVFSGLVWFAAARFDAWVDVLMPRLPEWLTWLEGLLWLLFAGLAAVLVFFTFTAVANLIGGPFNGLLAERVERHLTGSAPTDGGVLATLRQAPVMLFDELRKLGYYARWALPLLVLSFIPLLNVFAPFLWALFGAWMLAVEYADYPLGNRGLRGVQVRSVLRAHRSSALGFGTMTLAATFVPGLNLLVMPAAVAGATILAVERLRQ
ncbi:MAG: sulfate transporter CysZ [Gammaproteobacteria bacterium]|nr:sulfate transporter CysZ [Gammaproteobacteria bacterium]